MVVIMMKNAILKRVLDGIVTSRLTVVYLFSLIEMGPLINAGRVRIGSMVSFILVGDFPT